jgi:hypothetical protein
MISATATADVLDDLDSTLIGTRMIKAVEKAGKFTSMFGTIGKCPLKNWGKYSGWKN